jgi:hypothetical protein
MVTPSTTKVFVAGGPMIQNSIVVGVDVLQTLVPPPLSVVPEDSEEDAVLLSDALRAKKSHERPINKDLKFDFKAYRTKSRIVDLHLWPQPNTKAVSTNKILAEMMTLGYVMEDHLSACTPSQPKALLVLPQLPHHHKGYGHV